jgi:predicted NUDIX family NTP pyrophosphohydrolase
VKQPSGKLITAWAFRGDWDPSGLVSNSFQMEWPPKSGQRRNFPEVDRAEWFDIDEARKKILKGQLKFIDLLVSQVRSL